MSAIDEDILEVKDLVSKVLEGQGVLNHIRVSSSSGVMSNNTAHSDHVLSVLPLSPCYELQSS